jgi:serine/threonine protein kinase/tetratricopeptide (TPR) repeat protein
MVPRVGQRIGPYEILGRLGTGGMGYVFSAWDARLQRDVAIKLLREEYCTAEMRGRFLQEARAASGLNHPNICTVFDIGESAGDPYLVMELLKGRTLRSRIVEGPLPFDDVVQVATEIAEALSAAHQRGVIHRDIKPANIILVERPDGKFTTKVLDFGLAKLEAGEERLTIDATSLGSTVGTVAYMSPEQARGETLDARSDLFALGTVCYEMATGDVPFHGATSAMVFVQLLSHPPESARQLNPDLPREFERILNKLLAKDRTQRYQTAAEAAAALATMRGKGSSSKSFWRGLFAPGAVRPEASDGYDDEDMPASESTTPSPRLVEGEAFLRPVKRVVSSDPASSAGASRAHLAASGDGAASDAAESGAVSGIEAAAVETGGSEANAAESLAAEPRDETVRGAVESSPEQALRGAMEAAGGAEPKASRWAWVAAGCVALAALAVGGLLLRLAGRQTVAATSPEPMGVILGNVTNNTGDEAAGAVLIGGLELDLAQSPRLAVFAPDALLEGMHVLNMPVAGNPSIDDARKAAHAVGAEVVVFGETHLTGSTYHVSLRAYDVATGAKRVELNESAPSREQMPGAIDRLTSELRAGLGENGDAVAKTSVPLAREATANLEGLAAYSRGEGLRDSGQFLDAMHAFDAAAAADPHFAAAGMALAEIFRRQRAEVEAAKAATEARDSSGEASLRTRGLAGAAYEIYASGDLPQGESELRALLQQYPGDPEILTLLATCLRLEGKFEDSLATGQSVLQRYPYALDAASDVIYSMIALERIEAASQVESQMQQSGRVHPGLRVLINYLGPRDDGPQGVDITGSMGRLAPQQYEAMVLDAGGLLDGGLEAWRAVAAQASANPELLSAAGQTLAEAALDRALVGECAAATGLLPDAQSYPQGPDALFDEGIAGALCGNTTLAEKNADTLAQDFGKNWAVTSFLLPDLRAMLLWKQHDVAALQLLDGAAGFDRVSLTPYLRGLVHLRARQPGAAIQDFQGILDHRGATTLANPVIYAMAQIGLARAYAASGDTANAIEAYKRFAALWAAADPQLPMMREAAAHVQ